MKINVTYDANTLATAPSDFYTTVNYAVDLFDSSFSNPATINIEVGYGDFPLDGSPVAPLGESEDNNLSFADYATVKNILAADGAPGSTTLPSTSPLAGGLVIDSAEAKALGLTGASTAIDGWVGIASNAALQADGEAWSFGTTATPAANQFYIVGVIEHEFSEVMGRDSYLGEPGEYGIADLYRYSAPGMRQNGGAGAAYFSTDSGNTNLDNWNNSVGSGDLGDWAASAGADAFLAQGNTGQTDGLSSTDETLMAALGWNATPPDQLDRYKFFAPETVNVAATPDGSNLPAATAGQFNLELVTAPVGTSFSPPSGYQGDAVEAGNGRSLQVLTGDMAIIDETGNDMIALGSGSQTVVGAVADTVIGGFGSSLIAATAGWQRVVGGSGAAAVLGGSDDTITGGSGPLSVDIRGSSQVLIGDSGMKGSDTVTGFSQVAGDRITFAGATPPAIGSVLASAQTSGGNTLITLPDGTTMTLVGITSLDNSFFA